MTTAAICDRCNKTIPLSERHLVEVTKPDKALSRLPHHDPDFVWDLCERCRRSLSGWKARPNLSNTENQ